MSLGLHIWTILQQNWRIGPIVVTLISAVYFIRDNAVPERRMNYVRTEN